jgi:hypothetical protein
MGMGWTGRAWEGRQGVHRPTAARPGGALRRATYRRWVIATAIGELAGFTIPALAGTGVAAAGVQPAAALALMVAAGAGEGAVLGGLGMGLTVALVTGAFLVRLLDWKMIAGHGLERSGR